MAEKSIQISSTEDQRIGVYSNMMQVRHHPEEFILDFLSVFGEQGSLAARVIVSPGHLKRVIRALEENMARYEESHGAVKTTDDPKGNIGFAL